MQDRSAATAGKLRDRFYKHVMDGKLQRDKHDICQGVVCTACVETLQSINAFPLLPDFYEGVHKIAVTVFCLWSLHSNLDQVIRIIDRQGRKLSYRCANQWQQKRLDDFEVARTITRVIQGERFTFVLNKEKQQARKEIPMHNQLVAAHVLAPEKPFD